MFLPLALNRSQMTESTQVEKMMRMFGQEVRTIPTTDVPAEEVVARAKMIIEEVVEYLDAAGVVSNLPKKGEIEVGIDPFKKPDLVEIADGLVDIIVVTKGGYHVYGIDGERLFEEEVMPSNFSKAVEKDGKMVVKKVNGKVQKPEGWFPPNIKEGLKKQGWNGE